MPVDIALPGAPKLPERAGLEGQALRSRTKGIIEHALGIHGPTEVAALRRRQEAQLTQVDTSRIRRTPGGSYDFTSNAPNL